MIVTMAILENYSDNNTAYVPNIITESTNLVNDDYLIENEHKSKEGIIGLIIGIAIATLVAGLIAGISIIILSIIYCINNIC